MDPDAEIERRLADEALRPQDESFTRRVLAALPPRAGGRVRADLRRSFELTTRLGLVLVVVAAAQFGFSTAAHDTGTILAIVFFAALFLGALAFLCGPLVPGSLWRLVSRATRYRR